MRRLLLAFTGLVLALAASALAGPRAPVPAKPAAVTATTLSSAAAGAGHGVGMSQYGAMGYANDGSTYDQILTHFYVGAELGPAPVARVRVLVGEAKGAVKLRSSVPFRVRDVFGKVYALPGRRARSRPEAVGDRERRADRARRADPLPSRYRAARARPSLPGPDRGRCQGPEAERRQRRRARAVPPGRRAAGDAECVAGEALKAQAVAARSYALSHRLTGMTFDLLRRRSQPGLRRRRRRERAHDRRRPGDDRGSPLLGRKADRRALPLDLGRKTLAAIEVFGKAVPYLVSVDDPHSDLSPVNRWGPTPVPETTVRKGLKLRTPVTALKLARGASGRVLSVRRHDDGRNVEGDRCRASLGRRAALDVDHRPGDALADASRRAGGLRQAADRDREGGRREGRRAVAADRRRLDAGRRPRRPRWPSRRSSWRLRASASRRASWRAPC